MKTFQLAKPHLLVVVGLPGAGKTFFASQFSDMFNAPYIDYGYFRHVADDENGTILANVTLAQLAKTKQTVVVEGRGLTLTDRRELFKQAHKAGYSTLFIWVQTEPATTEDRSVHNKKSATLTLDQYDRQAKQFQNLNRTDPVVVISGKHTFASQARVVLKKLADKREAIPVKTGVSRSVPHRTGRISG
jgi:predicted kinase